MKKVFTFDKDRIELGFKGRLPDRNEYVDEITYEINGERVDVKTINIKVIVKEIEEKL